MSVEDNMTGTLRSQSKGHEPVIVGTLTRASSAGGTITHQDVMSGHIVAVEPMVFFDLPTTEEWDEALMESIAVEKGLAMAFNNRQDPVVSGETAQPIGAKDNGNGVMTSMQVRRLTPTECERLQGFPDGWTLVPWRGKDAPDGPRYKALGNSMAVPVMFWIGQRIKIVQEDIDATLAATSPQSRLDRQAQSTQARRSDSGLHEEGRR